MYSQPSHLRIIHFIYSPFLVVGKYVFVKALYSHSALFTSILDAAIQVITNTSANNLTFLEKEINHGR